MITNEKSEEQENVELTTQQAQIIAKLTELMDKIDDLYKMGDLKKELKQASTEEELNELKEGSQDSRHM